MNFRHQRHQDAVMRRLRLTGHAPPTRERRQALQRHPRPQHGAQLVTGDFRDHLPHLRGVKTFFTDPPYNLGFKYGPVGDKQDPAAYRAMMQDMARLTYSAAAPDASLFIVHHPETLADLWPVLTEQWRFRNWITWCHPGLSGTSPKKWTRSSRTVLWLTKGDPRFDGKATLRPFESPELQRAAERRQGKLVRGAPLYDWWVVPAVLNTHPEYLGYANQIPSEVIRRCIKATTRPGDLVADPFAGTGSTIKTAASLGRRAWGCDSNPQTRAYWTKPTPTGALTLEARA